MMNGRQTCTVINTYVQTLLATAYAKGVSRRDIFKPFEGHGFAEKPGDRISLTLMTRLWQRIADLTNDPDLGLHVGERMRPGSFHIISHLVMNTPSVAEAFDVLLKYQRLASEGGVFDRLTTDNGVDITYTPNTLPIPMTRFQVECIFSSIVTFSRWLLEADASPRKVCFSHSVEHDHGEYDRIFRCPVLFGRQENLLSVPERQLSMKIPHADPELRVHYEQIADELMETLTRRNRLSHSLKEWLHNRTDIHQTSIETAASFCKMTPRTLQRRLTKEGTSFKELKNSVLMEKAHYLLLHTDIPVSRIAEELGYINDSSLHRGFKKWFSMTPHEYRNRLTH